MTPSSVPIRRSQTLRGACARPLRPAQVEQQEATPHTAYLWGAQVEGLRDLAVELPDVTEALDAPSGAAVRQLRVEDQPGPQTGRRRGQSGSVRRRLGRRAPHLLVLHQVGALPGLALLFPQSQWHLVYFP